MLQAASRVLQYADAARLAVGRHLAISEQSRAAAQRLLAARLGRLKGLPQKFGQLMSLLDDSQKGPLDDLQEKGEPLDWPLLAHAVEESWGRRWNEVLAHVEQPGHAASLGQVHRVRLKDGRDAALKVQYPGVAAAIETDLASLGWLSAPLGGWKGAFDTEGYRRTIRAGLAEELDYRIEAQRQKQIGAHAAETGLFETPQVMDEHCTEKVLVTQWREGDAWDAVAGYTRSQRENLARRLAEMWLDGLFRRGVVHADLHPGNIRFLRLRDGAKPLLYDFGSVFEADLGQRRNLAGLLRASLDGERRLLPYFARLGFNAELLEPVQEKLPQICRLLFEPFASKLSYDWAQWRLNERMSQLLGPDRINFRLAGPPELLLLIRSWHGVAYYLQRLNVRLNGSRILREVLARTPELQAPVVEPPASAPTQAAKRLRLSVCDRGRVKAKLSFPAAAVENLPDLIDEDLRARLLSQGVNVAAIAARAVQDGLPAGPLFELDEFGKQVYIWIE